MSAPAAPRSLAGRLDLCSINTATLGHREPLAVTLDRVARAGFGGVAPWRREVEGQDVRPLARQIRALGLKVSGYCRSTYFPAATAVEREANIAANVAALRDAAELGAACFVLVVGGIPDGGVDLAGARAQVTDGIARLLETARAVDVPLAVEPLHPMYAASRSVVNTLAQALALCDAVDPDRRGHVGVAVDVYHCWWDPAIADALRAAGAAKRLLAHHVCDWLRDTTDMLLDRGMMGDGVIDLRGFRGQVEAAGYHGMVEVEIFSQADWWRRDPQEVLAVAAERLQSVC